ncbi:MAG: transposase [Candidatus Marinimicrobia bacterium]|jgi:REP element-mobilizing transposase RayT|nr:transposase [Candidatus Neomarinimicrobiota bacterium]MCK9560986.1 transposase [Candidatus Neomarinimicrobiota bacterium]MDD5062199.1 transposase [Candidatus Neomarinimicrobiota bacterium]
MIRTRNRATESEYPIFATSTCINWLPLLTPDDAKQILVDVIINIQKRKQFKIFAYVIMHNHFHIIYSSSNPAKDIGNIKSFSARQIIQYYQNIGAVDILRKMQNARPNYRIDRTYKFWQEGYHPKQIINMEIFQQKIDYIHLNPVRKDYVDLPERWKWSSANRDGLIEIDPVED